jgi:hypothetical protein
MVVFLEAKCPAKLDREQIALGNNAGVRIGQNSLPAPAPNDRQIVAEFIGPSQPRVRSEFCDSVSYGTKLDSARFESRRDALLCVMEDDAKRMTMS